MVCSVSFVTELKSRSTARRLIQAPNLNKDIPQMFSTLRPPLLTGLFSAGLDISEHGMHAYPSDLVSGGVIA